MKIFGLVGSSGSGKTTLLTCLLPDLQARGYSVSTVKHTHHNFDIDRPGKDSYRHRQAGAREVLLVSNKRWALMHELETPGEEPDMATLLPHLTPVDLLMVEGFKRYDYAKIEVFRPSLGKPLLALRDHSIIAVASDQAVAEAPVPVLDLNNIGLIAETILAHCGLEAQKS